MNEFRLQLLKSFPANNLIAVGGIQSLTALVENEQGEWNIVSYTKEEFEAGDSALSKTIYAEVI